MKTRLMILWLALGGLAFGETSAVKVNSNSGALVSPTAPVLRSAMDLVPSSGGHALYVSQSSTATDTRTSLSAYDPAKPFLTLAAAKSAASSGDTIYVFAGSYTVSASIAKNGVNWWYAPGASVSRTDDTLEGIWDDGGSAMTFKVAGHGSFSQETMEAGCKTINCSHASSVMSIRAETLAITATGGGNANLIECSAGKLFVDFNEATMGGDGGGDNHGVWWLNGELHVHGKRLYGNSGGYYGVGGSVSSTPTGDAFIQIDEIASDQAPVYTSSGSDSTAAMWVNALVLKNTIGGTGVLAAGDNRLYVTAQKIFGSIAMEGSGSPLLYLTADKVTALSNGSSGTANLFRSALSGATGRIAVKQWDRDTFTGETIKVTSGTVTIFAGDFVAGTAHGVEVTGGTVRLQGLRIDTSGSNTQNPATKSGGTLKMYQCTLVAEATRNAIEAGSAQTVSLMGVWSNTALDADVTNNITSGLSTDADVQ